MQCLVGQTQNRGGGRNALAGTNKPYSFELEFPRVPRRLVCLITPPMNKIMHLVMGSAFRGQGHKVKHHHIFYQNNSE
jgi:hypothetical protein